MKISKSSKSKIKIVLFLILLLVVFVASMILVAKQTFSERKAGESFSELDY